MQKQNISEFPNYWVVKLTNLMSFLQHYFSAYALIQIQGWLMMEEEEANWQTALCHGQIWNSGYMEDPLH